MPFVKREQWRKLKICRHPEHNPPAMIVLKPGEYTWKCPACGEEQTFVVQDRSMLYVQEVE